MVLVSCVYKLPWLTDVAVYHNRALQIRQLRLMGGFSSGRRWLSRLHYSLPAAVAASVVPGRSVCCHRLHLFVVFYPFHRPSLLPQHT